MDILKVTGVKIDGIVACLPENLLDNRNECIKLFGDKTDTVIKSTGINARCIAEPGTTALDLDVYAAKELIEKTGTDLEQIGAVVCVTFTPENLMPGDASSAQARLGISNYSVALDLHIACSGYGYGLYLAAVLANSLNKKVLLLDGDVQSTHVSKQDKATVPVLSDIGTATLISPGQGDSEWKFTFYTDGSSREVLVIPAGGSKCPIKQSDLEYKEYEDGSKRRDIDIYMDGFEVFRFVAQNVSKFLIQFMNEINVLPENLDAFVPHQANIYMIGQLARKLKFSPEKCWKSADEFGNPASASIPLTIAKNATKWFEENKGGDVLLSGFGAGLSISAGKINLSDNGFYSIIKYSEGE